MTLHDVWAEFTAELAHLFARFHSHPVVVAAVAAQAAPAPVPAPVPAPAPAPIGADPIDHSVHGIVLGTVTEGALGGKPAANGPAGGAPGPLSPTPAVEPTPAPTTPAGPIPPAQNVRMDVNGQPYSLGTGLNTFVVPVTPGQALVITAADFYDPLSGKLFNAAGELIASSPEKPLYLYFVAQAAEDLRLEVETPTTNPQAHVERQG